MKRLVMALAILMNAALVLLTRAEAVSQRQRKYAHRSLPRRCMRGRRRYRRMTRGSAEGGA